MFMTQGAIIKYLLSFQNVGASIPAVTTLLESVVFGAEDANEYIVYAMRINDAASKINIATEKIDFKFRPNMFFILYHL